MTKLKTLNSVVRTAQKQRILNALSTKQFTITPKHPYSVNAAAKPVTWEQAKPLTECPQPTKMELMRGLLPGGKYYKTDMFGFLCALHREKGDIFYLPGMFGKANMLMTQIPEDFEHVFRNEGTWPERNAVELMTYHRNVHRKDFFGESSGLPTTQGKAWSDFRTAVNPILMNPRNVNLYLPTMTKVNDEFIARIRKIRDPNTLEVPENFIEEIHSWTLESIAVVALDRHLGLIAGTNPDGKRIADNLRDFSRITNDLEIKPSLWRTLPNRKFRRCMAALDDIVSITEKYITEAIERIEKSKIQKPEADQSVLERLLKIDKKVATIMALDMLEGSVETTTTPFTGLLFSLAENPDKQQKLREEILKILPHKDSPLTVENIKNLPYLRSCLKESMRIYPVGPGNIRTLTKDLVISGYRVPKGTVLLLVSLNLLKDKRHFSHPTQFLPERWMRQSKTVAMEQTNQCPNATRSDNPFVFLPFGFGPRSCVGRRLVEMELVVGVARLIRNFNVEFNYSTENAFQAWLVNVPNIPLKFKFTDVEY